MNEAFAAFRWRDVVDIALVAVVVYRILVMFRGTRAVQMLIGLSCLVAGSLLARRLVSTLLGASRAERAHVIDEIVDAVESLTARRIGALIVVERSAGLRQYAELGVAVDGLVSADLLVSVFLPYSPLHDGAVFVEGSRLVAAGCFLPLSRNLQIARSLGTRHRAALGISEETDAVALAVSEESGRVTIAVGGHIETVRDLAVLRSRLGELIGAPAPAPGSGLVRGFRRLLSRAPDSA